MHILITDSGVGGLSVVAYTERFVRTQGISEPVRLTFANAAPANDYGYNSMPTKEEKIETFDRFLTRVTERFQPDSIYVACNTLSVLLSETSFQKQRKVPAYGIVETGVQMLLDGMSPDPRTIAMIFATPTTIEAGAYARLLEEQGIDSSRVVNQACPGLADTISEDREGERTRQEIALWVDRAIAQMPRRDVPVVAAMACTHYGYRQNQFAEALAERNIESEVINPNESAVGDVLADAAKGKERDAEIKVVSRYVIPPATTEALTFFLSDISPRTAHAMQNFTHLPDLF